MRGLLKLLRPKIWRISFILHIHLSESPISSTLEIYQNPVTHHYPGAHHLLFPVIWWSPPTGFLPPILYLFSIAAKVIWFFFFLIRANHGFVRKQLPMKMRVKSRGITLACKALYNLALRCLSNLICYDYPFQKSNLLALKTHEIQSYLFPWFPLRAPPPTYIQDP